MAEFGPTYVITPPPAVSVPVVGGGAFAVRRIYCVGRNYLEHIREMGGDERDAPFFFQKPTDAIVLAGAGAEATIPYPPATGDFQYEIELVLAIGRGGRDIAVQDAVEHVFGTAVGVDLTRRDVQVAARKAGRPWEIGKAFDHSAPVAAIVPLAGPLPTVGTIRLSVNGETRQAGDLAQLIWNCAEIVANLSTLYTLAPGDLIYTGTPAGVGPLVAGDRVLGQVDGLPGLSFTVGQAMATMSSPGPRGLRNDAARYGRVAQAFHWGIAALIIAAIALGLSLDSWPRGSATHERLIFIHKSIGVTVLLLAILRLSWLLRSPAPPPADRLATWERRTAWGVHKLLYVLMFAMPLSGIVLSQAVGKPVTWWGFGPLPQFIPFDPALPPLKSPWVIASGGLHTVAFKLALFVALALHVAGVLKHALVDRDAGMFRRMWGR